MANLLMIESWVGASGNLLPPLLCSMGHTYTFVTRKPAHYQNPLSNEEHAVFRYASKVIEVETNDVEQIIQAVKDENYDGVITVCDYYIETVCKVAKILKLPCPFSSNVKEIRQKHLLRQMIDRAKLPNVNYRLAKTWEEVKKAAEEIAYPLVLKPVDLASSAFVKLIKNETDLEQAFHELEGFPLNFRDQPRNCTYLLEEYLDGEEVSVESVSYQGEIHIIGITDKSVTGNPYFIENGHMFPADLPDSVTEQIITYVKKVLKEVGYHHGIAHTEVKITEKGPRIVEINPRTAGNYIVELIERVTDINLLEVFVHLALGERPELMQKNDKVKSAAIMFYVPKRGGKIVSVLGEDMIREDEHTARYKIEDCVGKEIEKPIDNACYLGHIVAVDESGKNARKYAEKLIGYMQVEFQ